MARPGITYTEIAEAAAELEAKGMAATVDSVRAHVGTGSRTTIANHLRNWKSHQSRSDVSGVPQELVTMLKSLWERVQNLANLRVEEMDKDTKERVEQIQQLLDQEKKEVGTLQTKIRQLEEQNHEQKYVNEKLKEEIELFKQEKGKLETQLVSIKEQLEEQKDENSKLHKINHRIQDNLEHYQAEVIKQRQESELALEKQRVEFTTENQFLKQSLQDQINTNHQVMIENKHLSEQVVELKATLKNVTEENAEIKLKFHASIIELRNLQSKYDFLEKEAIVDKHELKGKIAIINDLENKSAILSDQVKKLDQSVEQSEHIITLLRSEKLDLVQEQAVIKEQMKQLQKMVFEKS